MLKGYSVDIAPVSFVDESSRLQRHWFVYQLHILNKFWGFKQTALNRQAPSLRTVSNMQSGVLELEHVPFSSGVSCDSNIRDV